MTEEVQPLAGYTPVIQPVLPTETNQEFLLEVLHFESHHLPISLLEDAVSRDLNPAVTRLRLEGIQLATETMHLVDEVPLLRRGRDEGLIERGKLERLRLTGGC